MRLHDLFEERKLTQQDIDILEQAIDRLFNTIGVDVEFTKHFLQRVNDERNGQQITLRELGQLFSKEYRKWGKAIAKLTPKTEAILKDFNTNINIPFVIRWNERSKELDLIAKTILRKKNFFSKDKEFVV